MRDFDELELSTETIRELGAEEMSQVAGGGPDTIICLTGYYPTINAPCPTLQDCFEGALR